MLPGQARLLWAAAFVAALLAPVLLSLVTGNDNPLISQLAIQSGLLATGLLVCAVVTPSRLRSLTRALGIEGVLGVHRLLGMLVTLMVVVHIILVLIATPSSVALFDPRQWSMPSRAAIGATVGLVVLVGLAVVRHRVRRRYALWRWVHLILAGAVLVLTALHIWWLRHLVNDPVLRATFAVIAAVVIGMLSYRWVWRPSFDKRGAYEVREVRAETDQVNTLVIGPRRPRHGFDVSAMKFAPGQFAWLRLKRSVTAEEHPFTITSCPRGSEDVEFTIRNVGDFTSGLAELKPGDPVWIDGPHGDFTWDDSAYKRALVLIAAGVGITPMISMLRALAHRGDRRPVLLVSGARTEDELLFRDELSELADKLDLTVVEVLSRPPDGWKGLSGRIDREVLAEVLPERTGRRKIEYFICGPGGMVTDVTAALEELRVDPARIHTEQFDMV
ncbi:ferredoxin reductase family protein [Pseudonocardia acaciae]|uniref:ferredoxin reductase family protein n=1 Tax=Pseudonocardia acaciae TaxID=551276 RepID=UPI000A0398C6|nr:ferredoxin reductase family protein [Pseudonocardia acaciae]